MCGIVGLVHHDGAPAVERSLVQRMCDGIRHRGPDDEGVYVSGRIGLGMRRLSIIDVAGSRQPMATEDGSAVIVFNGEIYNYRELRRDLTARGHRFRTAGDTETILRLYQEEGPECVQRLRGMFAFAIWDESRRSLLLARDRFGIKPLYLAHGPRGIAFASELKALPASGFPLGELDWEAVDMYLQLGYIPAPFTPFTNVRKLEPGHTLLFRQPGGEQQLRRYWDLPATVPQEERPADLTDRVLEWFDGSVVAHLVSDVPVAAFLSGGLDSSAVVASMALHGTHPHAFTARYSGSGAARADETSLARELAVRYQADLTVVPIDPDISSIFERMVIAVDEPLADDSVLPTWALSKAVGASYKVALTGTGGDELFAGYWRHLGLTLGDRYARLPAPFRRLAGRAASLLREPGDGGLAIDRAKRFLRSGSHSTPDRYLDYVSRSRTEERLRLYHPELRSAVSGRAARDHFRRVFERGGSPRGLAGGLYLDYKTYLPDDILALSDRLAMAHSLEVRVPFVDHELVEHIFPVPEQQKLGWLTKKRLLREALRGRLPEAHFAAPKRGFVGPTAAWLRGELRPLIEDELSAERMKRLGVFDPGLVQGLLGEHFDRRHNREGILWALLTFSVWYRSFVEGQPAVTGAGTSATWIPAQGPLVPASPL